MAPPIARALTENALDAIERLADHLPDTSPQREAASACVSGTIALLTILHALVDEMPGLSAEQHLQQRNRLAEHAKKAGHAADQAAQSLSSPHP